jgi:hypothetical protein
VRGRREKVGRGGNANSGEGASNEEEKRNGMMQETEKAL